VKSSCKEEYLAINECKEYDEVEEHLRQFVIEKPKPGSHTSFYTHNKGERTVERG
jgi:hypothetical protein